MNRNLILGFLLFLMSAAVLMGGCADKETTKGTDTGSGSETKTDTESTETETTDTESTETKETNTEATDTEAFETEATETQTTDTEATDTEATETEATETESVTDTEATETEATETESATDTDGTDSSPQEPGKYCYQEDLERTQIKCLDHGETCDDPEILPGEGTYTFSNAPFQGNYTWADAPLECFPNEKLGQDLVYAVDLPAMKKLSARVDGIPVNEINFYPKLFVSTSCEELAASCVAGQSASFENVRAEYTSDSDQPVRLYLVIDSDLGDAGLFSLDVKFGEPNVANIVGDSCAEAVNLVLPASGSTDTLTFSHESLSETPSGDNVCDSTGRDGFFAFTVDAPSKVKLQTVTSVTSKHAVFLYEDGCGAENAADFVYSEGGAEPATCGSSKFSSKLWGYYTLIEIEAVPGVNYIYGVQLSEEATQSSEFELTITVE